MDSTQNDDVRQLAEALAAAGVELDPSQLSDEAQEILDHARDEAKQLQAAAETHIREHPLAAVGLVFLAGVVLGNLLGRR